MAARAPRGRELARRFAAALLAASGLCTAPGWCDSGSDAADLEPPPPYFDRHAEGWFWYHDLSLAPPPAADKQPEPASLDPAAEIAAERKELEAALDRAIMRPTTDNVKAYLVLNQKLMNQAGQFAAAWRGAIWMNPELDHRLVSQTGSAAYVQADVTAAQDEQRLSAASHSWGLLFFFRGTCPYCHKFAPVLKAFAARYGFHLVPISLDGGSLPDFASPQANAGAGEALGVEGVPAVYVVNPNTREVAPAVFGLVGWTELAQRILYAIDHSGDAPHGEDATAALALSGESP